MPMYMYMCMYIYIYMYVCMISMDVLKVLLIHYALR